MDNPFITGFAITLSAVLVTYYLPKLARARKTNGKLHHGVLMLVLGWVCLAGAALAGWAWLFDASLQSDPGEKYAAITLMLIAGGLGVFCLFEYFLVRGHFDHQRLQYRTLLAGRVDESWDTLDSLSYNPAMSWYVLTFASGLRVRMSAYLNGHGEVLMLLSQRGIEID